jgi:nucleotide-binding universal stress UspA family protein
MDTFREMAHGANPPSQLLRPAAEATSHASAHVDGHQLPPYFPATRSILRAASCGSRGRLRRPWTSTEAEALRGNEAVHHLRHHGINAVKCRAVDQEDEIADALIEECRKLDAKLLMMGRYGHSRLHELLPRSATDRVLRRSPFPLLIAH